MLRSGPAGQLEFDGYQKNTSKNISEFPSSSIQSNHYKIQAYITLMLHDVEHNWMEVREFIRARDQSAN